MAINVSFEEPALALLRVSGVMRRAEVDLAKHQVHDHMQAHGKCSAMICLEEGFSNLECPFKSNTSPERRRNLRVSGRPIR